jgi:deazaflavin-dependent oxidoreductase (nitroreductase family)
MSFRQCLLDRIRVLNKHLANKLMIRIAGRRFGHFAILTHYGRRTGKAYRIPIIAEPIEDGFMIALTYGRKVDWGANVLAMGECRLKWKNKEYALVRPEYADPETGMKAFPGILRPALRAAGVKDFMKLSIGG